MRTLSRNTTPGPSVNRRSEEKKVMSDGREFKSTIIDFHNNRGNHIVDMCTGKNTSR